jgi:hypothetical protein
MPTRIDKLIDKKSEEWFGTPEKKMRVLQLGVYASNLYALFGILFLIWLLFHDQINQLWINIAK